MSTLPTPSRDAQKHSLKLLALIQQEIKKAGGWIDFSQFMQLALYAPQLGYYSAGNQKFGTGGDFVTAPEISALFGQTLAQQVAQILALSSGSIMELGAGTGRLAVHLLHALEHLDCLPDQYYILDVSDHLRQVQLEYLQDRLSPQLLRRVVWLNQLPVTFTGVVLGNEVLDAIPVHIVHTKIQGLFERGVMLAEQGLTWSDKPWDDAPASGRHLLDEITKLSLPEGYISEFCPAANGLIASLALTLERGVILMIDYGFSASEYYHPQRNLGTLMCHYQHYAHTDPLLNIGLQDITAHVNFSSIAYAGVDNGLQLSGFCSQAQFLMNCGILELMARVSPSDMARYTPLAAAAQKLLSPAEMGDLFKVIAFSKNMPVPLLGFTTGDKAHTL
ncbi:MAG: SAM-dependent methyltransferase [Methylophilales bacterium]|jgi:SAM-dependent MidA family methyltransferase|nr:SAM-dependent methyltransferase [Methylophilales bacterium]